MNDLKGITYMEIVNKVMGFFGLTEEYEEKNVQLQTEKKDRNSYAHNYELPLEPPQTSNSKKHAHIQLVEPRTFNEAQNIANYLARNLSIVINIRSLDHKSVVRLIDFMSGVAYALEGDIRRIDKESFLCVPKQTNIQGTIHDGFS